MSVAKNSIIPDSGLAATDRGSSNELLWAPAFAGAHGKTR